MGEKKDRFQVWRVRKEKQKLQFPKHWGSPPKIHTRDYRKITGDYGYGSSTLATWIAKNIIKDTEENSPLDILDRELKAKCQWHLLLLENHTPYTRV